MKKRYGLILGLVIIALMFFVLRDVDFVEVLELLYEIDAFWFWAAFGSSGLVFVLWALRFRNTLGNLLGNGFHFFYLLMVILAGVFVNAITPGSSVGGEPVRAYFLNKKFGKSKSKFLGIIVADKFFNILAFSFFLVLSILFVLFFVNLPFVLEIIFGGFLVGIVLIFIGVFVFWIRKIKLGVRSILKFLYWFGLVKKRFSDFAGFEKYSLGKFLNFTRGFKGRVFNRRVLVAGLCLSFVMWILNFLSSYFLFLAFDFRISFLSVIIVISLSYAIGDLSPVPGGIGLVESSMFLLYSAMGVPGPLAITVSLLSRMIYYFYAMVVGGLSLTYLKLRY